ncbi:hypothetical protein CF15_00715 [Pyrodictium occultum]|uniref:Aspartate/glutamate/uridylate kinase domain-containing protein n=1 Tax=Pyrodictium occultum TaxID=2309 RepID=A0A0V8RTN0_PYROC|nr:hypothetical protein CF15_00715 [Pyrodictium occultum]
MLTDKKSFRLNYRVVDRVAEEVARALDEGTRLGIVLGGGSYGHITAHNAQNLGAPAAEALSLVAMYMLELAMGVADILSSKGVNPLIYPPHSFCSPEGLVPRCNWAGIERDMAVGITPIVYGDVYACSGGWCIVSGDELAVEMACRLGSPQLIYVTDVDGILDPGGRLVEEARLEELEGLTLREPGDKVDVTGGLRRKIKAVKANRCPGLHEVLVVNGLRPGRIYSALTGRGVGTRIIL